MNTPELLAATSRQSPHQLAQKCAKTFFSKGKFHFFWEGTSLLPASHPHCWTWRRPCGRPLSPCQYSLRTLPDAQKIGCLLFVYLSITLLNEKVCAREFTINALIEYGNVFGTVG